MISVFRYIVIGPLVEKQKSSVRQPQAAGVFRQKSGQQVSGSNAQRYLAQSWRGAEDLEKYCAPGPIKGD